MYYDIVYWNGNQFIAMDKHSLKEYIHIHLRMERYGKGLDY